MSCSAPASARLSSATVSHDEIGEFVRSVPVPSQVNDPDITVVSLDLHTDGFVVRCEIGGSRGIGRAVAVRLARCGFDIWLTYRSNHDEARKTKEQIDQFGRLIRGEKLSDTLPHMQQARISEVAHGLGARP